MLVPDPTATAGGQEIPQPKRHSGLGYSRKREGNTRPPSETPALKADVAKAHEALHEPQHMTAK